MNQRGCGNSSAGGNEWQQGALHAGQFAAVELPLEFEANEQEEDRHERIVNPMLEAEAGH